MPNNKIQSLTVQGVTYDIVDNTSGYITGITSSDVTGALGFTPYNSTNPNGYTTNTGTITSVKTTAGAHTTINVSSGAANFNVPTKTSHLTNDSGFLTSYTETDPTVPNWAKAETKPSYTFSEIGSTPTTLSGYGITNAYTKTEIDGLVAGVLHYKGTKASVANLPTTGNITGDVWHITADGSEYAWDGSAWQELGTAIDLSGYATKATTLAGYGITDAKIQNGTITLGSNTITPLTSFTETDPTVPSWAKASTKPTYTAAEVGALPDNTVIPSKTSDLTNDSGFITSDSDEKVKQTPIGDSVSTNYGLIVAYNNGNTEVTDFVRATNKIYINNSTPSIIIGKSTDTQRLSIRPDRISFIYNSGNHQGYLMASSITGNDKTWTLPDKSGTVALTSDIPDTSSFLTSETDPIFSASAAASITSTDISNWNAKVSDDKTWNGVTLSSGGISSTEVYIPVMANTSATTAYKLLATPTPTAKKIVQYDGSAYLHSTTPSVNDNSTKVATTAYVDAAIPDVSGFITSDSDTTYTLSNALSSHKFTSTLTAGGSGSGTSTTTMEFVAGTGITLTDDTTNKKITIASSVVNTDEKLKVNSGSTNTDYLPVLTTVSSTASTKYYSTAFTYVYTDNTATLSIGQSSVKNGRIRLHTTSVDSILIQSETLTGGRTITLPNKTGTVALTSDVPQVYSSTNTGGYLTMATLPIYDGTVV